MRRRTITVFIMVLFVAVRFAAVTADEVYSKTEAANRLYKQGKFAEALKLYEDALLLSPQDDKLKINRGLALFGTGDVAGAEKSMEGALSEKDRNTLATAHYNLGNILYRKGEAMMQKGDQQAKEAFTKARDQYIQSLDIDPTAIDAKWNLQLTHARLKQLEQQQQQQDKNKSGKKQPPPSEKAKKVKAEADRLVKEGAYKKALTLMTKLLQSDSTAVSYGSYTKRLNDVATSQ